MKKGKFIVIEGQGFSGKTEQISLLVNKLKELGIDVVETQEPGGVKGALKIREELLKRRALGAITPEEEVGLFYKSRGIFLEKLVKPALEANKWVLSTRFSASTFVYQGAEGGIDLNFIQRLEDKVVGDLEPDLYILLDVEAKEIFRRMKAGKRERHGYNELDMTKLVLRQKAYKELAVENRYKNWVIINGNKSISSVQQEIWSAVDEKFSFTRPGLVKLKNNKQELMPEKELEKDGFRWFVYSEKDTGLRLVCIEDLITGVVVTTTIANSKNRTAAHRAWAGARHSRAPGAPWEIMYEMGEKGVDPDQKLDEMFRNYGHKSVGDMAHLEISTHNTPMHLCLALFNNASVNAGQEKSSRYQAKFKDASLHPLKNYLPDDFPASDLIELENQYQSFGKTALDNYAVYKDEITSAFEKFYKPGETDKGALNSRVMDCVRFFLPLGTCSGLSLDTSARDWSRIISELKGSPISFYHRVALQIEQLFTPSKEIEESLIFKAEAPSLVRHSEATTLTNDNLTNLQKYILAKTNLLKVVPVNKKFRGKVEQNVNLLSQKYSEGDKMVVQYLLTLWPGLDRKKSLDWVNSQTPTVKKKISGIIFAGHNHNHELPLWAGTTGMTLELQCFMGEVRDWNRHRANKRFIPVPLIYGQSWTYDTAMQVMACGFGLPLYLTEVPKFAKLAKDFENALKNYYKKLYDFVGEVEKKYGNSIDYSFVLNLLPLAHQTDIWMHGDPKQSLYLTHLRARNGGHINYRDLSYKANQLVSKSDPYLSGLKIEKKPDPASRVELFDRS